MNLLAITILISFFSVKPLWASPASPSQLIPVQEYKGVNYYVLPESKTVVLENPIRVDVSIISKKPEPGYYVNVYGQIDDSVRPEIAEIKASNPGYEMNFLGVTSLQKVTVDLGVGSPLQVQMASGGGIFFQTAEFLSQEEGDKLISKYKAGQPPRVEVSVSAKAPSYTVMDQATLDYVETCQRLKNSALKTNVAGAVNSLLSLISNQFRSRSQGLKQKLIESILKRCVSVGDTSSLKANDWPKAPVQFLNGQGSETIMLHYLDYISNTRTWKTNVEVSIP